MIIQGIKIRIVSLFIILQGIFMLPGLHAQQTDAIGNLLFEDTIRFRPLSSWILMEEGSIWEIGEPSGEVFHSAMSGRTAMITDTSGTYPVNLDDGFTLKIPQDEYYWGEGILSFYHRFDTDSLQDGGFMEVSYDGGLNWINVLFDTNHLNTNFIGLYSDTLKGGEYGFSGSSGDWQYVELYWHWLALVKKSTSQTTNSILIRFHFTSDESDNSREGWMIDDMVFRGYDVSGHLQSLNKEAIQIFPIPASRMIYIHKAFPFSSALILEIYDTTGRLKKKIQYEQNGVNISDLEPGIYFIKILEGSSVLTTKKMIRN